jgi:hypothetical protein
LSPRPSAWVLNLDADSELAAQTHTPASARAMAQKPAQIAALVGLIGPSDVVIGEGDRVARGAYAGRAWCPTPWAMDRLSRAGAQPVAFPPLAVLRRVNHRRFSSDLGQTLPGARYVTTLEDLLVVIAGESPTSQWLLKRPFGFAGRGRRRVARGDLEAPARTWVVASLRTGEGLQVEPWVLRGGDFALHGHVSRAGAIVLGQPTSQDCDENGAWKKTSRITDLTPFEREGLATSARSSGRALYQAGYFGPFGVDAFRWRRDAGFTFNARSEINARYSMGWAIGMSPARPDLEDDG